MFVARWLGLRFGGAGGGGVNLRWAWRGLFDGGCDGGGVRRLHVVVGCNTRGERCVDRWRDDATDRTQRTGKTGRSVYSRLITPREGTERKPFGTDGSEPA